jgi:hypothetical protein
VLLLPVAHSENGRGEVHVAMTNEKWQRGVGTGIGLSNHVNTYRCARNPPDQRPRTTTLLELEIAPQQIALSPSVPLTFVPPIARTH